MQTKQQIRQLLASAGVSPNKRLGQHFLIDLNLVRLLVEAADISRHDVVLEVGCGTGSLTEALVERAGRTIAVEIDAALAEVARSRLAGADSLDLINGDVLENKSTLSRTVTDALRLARKAYMGRLLLVANLPYSVACPVVLSLTTGPTIAEAMYVTVQKQVADRMTAEPGVREYGSLTILLKATGDLRVIRTLKPAVFWPQPRVESAMVGFVREQSKLSRIQSMTIFREAVGLFMGHRRKMLKACTRFASGTLAAVQDWPAIFEQCSIDPTLRPERLPPERYVAIANACAACCSRT